tara:strand:- start:131 stop:283 length:153 start_codon:yes stop_codon:yes gene_type:complete
MAFKDVFDKVLVTRELTLHERMSGAYLKIKGKTYLCLPKKTVQKKKPKKK